MYIYKVLEKYFGYSSFRNPQEDIIKNIINQKDVLAILPTGGGKSLCYQLPALILDGLTLVISPLISLMKDQVDQLKLMGIQAEYLNSSISYANTLKIYENIEKNLIKLLYIAPERLENFDFLQEKIISKISFVAVDEAHSISQWGHDFRPSYRNISAFIEKLPKRPIVSAFTATATKKVRDDIIFQLNMNSPKVYVNSFDRPNIKFEIKEPSNKIDYLLENLDREKSTIIYAQTRKNVEKIYEKLKENDFLVEKYHAGLMNKERQEAQDNFIYDKSNIIVATNAFGMGIDKPDVREVIHYNMPSDIESYYQEAGRAGRDFLESKAVLLFSKQDIITAKTLIEGTQDPYKKEKLQDMIRYTSSTNCLRNFILNYFGEEADEKCMNCSSCLEEFETIDVTRQAQIILSCVYRMKIPFGMTMITNVLRGSKDKKLLSFGFDKISTYNLLKEYSETQIKEIISILLSGNYLKINQYKGLELTAKAKDVFENKDIIYAKNRKETKVKESKKTHIDGYFTDEILFARLKKLRLDLAKNKNIPPYIIFSNDSLKDMSVFMPTNIEEFLKISGVGEIKAKKYSEVFTKEINNYIIENNIEKKKGEEELLIIKEGNIINRISLRRGNINSVKKLETSKDSNNNSTKEKTHIITAKMYKANMSIQEIARIRDMRYTTILSHLQKAAKEKELINFDSKVDNNIKNLILKAIQSKGLERLKPLKEELPDYISYEDIHLVVIEQISKR